MSTPWWTSTLVAVALVASASCEPSDPPEAAAEPAASEPAPPATPAAALVARSVAYHDPGGAWGTRPLRLRWDSSRPGGERREARLGIDNGAGTLDLAMTFRGADLEYRSGPDGSSSTVDGSPEIPDETKELLRLDREGGDYWRNYFHFLVGLPMKLQEPGAEVSPEVETTTFREREARVVRVRYPGDTSYPHWEFFFDPATDALVGARFFREGPEVDGETIVMEGTAEAGGLRLPQTRHWYMNDDDEYLGTDEIAELEVG